VVSYLTEALVELGHQVTLFASGDSRTQAKLVPVIERHLGLDGWGSSSAVAAHTMLIHLPFARQCAAASLTTLHGRLDLPMLEPLYARFRSHALASISDSQRAHLPDANWCATVHHGLPRDLYHFQPHQREPFVFLGRISPEKRLDRAIEIAQRSGVPLVIAASVNPADKEYFVRTIEPLLDDPLINFIGEVNDDQKNALLGQARALLMPIDWPEPFGLVMIEALACGTPVIAYGHGSVPEIIEHGVTGFIVQDQDQAIAAAREVGRLDRRRCRQAFEERFTATTMALSYLRAYRKLIGRATQPEASVAT
jgi:glycosyltransferase involved in cell wall biosynthesis